MKEIRLIWRSKPAEKPDEPRGRTPWHPDSPEWRDMLTTLAEAGTDVFGRGTHWVEERDT